MIGRELIDRYFAGDLDRVELRRLESEAAANPDLRAELDRAYDQRTEDAGLLGLLPAADPSLKYCFSLDTLERFARNQLDEEDRLTVESHTPCPLCAAQLDAIRADQPAQVIPIHRRWKAATLIVVSAAASAALIVGPYIGRTPVIRQVGPWPACVVSSLNEQEATTRNNCDDSIELRIALMRITDDRSIHFVEPKIVDPLRPPALIAVKTGATWSAKVTSAPGRWVLLAVDGAPSTDTVESALRRWTRSGQNLDVGEPSTYWTIVKVE